MFRYLLCIAPLLAAPFTMADGLSAQSEQTPAARLPQTTGTAHLPGLRESVAVARDTYGIPKISGRSYLDVIRAEGFVHAQDRFFQMDAARRLAAGALAEVVGPPMLEMDKQYRRYRFRERARQIAQHLEENERELLAAYTEGVNAGLQSLLDGPGAPPEYGMLNVHPQPWRMEDSILVVFAMYDMLHMEDNVEKRFGVMRDALPQELFEFLTPIASRFDAPLIPGNPHDYVPMAIPGPDILDLRSRSAGHAPLELVRPMDLALGSNNWAVAAGRSAHGGAILANDPHLQLTAPGIWYRVHLAWPDPSDDEAESRLSGLSMPGLPGVVIGATAHIAWGFTNTMGDFQDFIIVEAHPDDPSQYRTPDGYERFGEVIETIHVRGRPAETLTLRTTRWGIVTDTDHRGRPLVRKWTAFEPDAVNLGVLDMLQARTLEDAVDIARRWSGPSQNMLLATHDGRIAWVVTGYLPDRFGYSGRYPVSWADGQKGWRGPLPEMDRPVMMDPEDGVLYTANNRTVGLDRAKRLGGVWVAGERASRIRDMLSHKRHYDEDDLFQMQLDTRVALFDFYHELALSALESGNLRGEQFEIALANLESWNGTADADQTAMPLLHVFRRTLHSMVIAPLVEPCLELDRTFYYSWFVEEEPVRRILEERPAHLLSPGYASWDELIEQALGHAVRRLTSREFPNGLATTWGEANSAKISHPITQALPAFSRALSMDETPQSGHPFAVRVAGPSFGASARMVISPGREDDAILQTPTGQSGHFQSPHFRDLHRYWSEGSKFRFLPGSPVSELQLVPQAESEPGEEHE